MLGKAGRCDAVDDAAQALQMGGIQQILAAQRQRYAVQGDRILARQPVEQCQVRAAFAHEIFSMDLDEAEPACTGEHLVEVLAVQAQPR